jgi:hypothetical protein
MEADGSEEIRNPPLSICLTGDFLNKKYFKSVKN